MSNYSDQLTALGLSPEVVARHLMANDMQKFSNREHANYGREYERQETLDGRYASTDSHWSSK